MSPTIAYVPRLAVPTAAVLFTAGLLLLALFRSMFW